MFIKKNHLSGDERAWVSYHDASTVEKTVGDGGKFGLISNMPARFRNFAIITATNIEVFYFIYFFFFFFFLFFGFIYFFYFQFRMYFPFCPTSEGVAARISALLGIESGEVLFFFFLFFFFHPPLTSLPPKGQQRPGQMWRTRPRPSSISWRPRLYLPRPHLHHHPCDSFGLPSGISSHHRESGDCF